MQLILIDAVDLGGWHHRLDDRHDTLAHVAIYVEWKFNQRSGETVELGKQDHALPSWPTDFYSMIRGIKPFLILRTKPKKNRLPPLQKSQGTEPLMKPLISHLFE